MLLITLLTEMVKITFKWNTDKKKYVCISVWDVITYPFFNIIGGLDNR